MNSFRNRVALVTGASSGIGEAIAVALAQKGATVILTARDEARLAAVQQRCEDAGGQAWSVRAEVTDDAQMQALADAVHARHEALDILVNNAGVVMAGLMAEVELSDWQRLMDINVLGVVRACRLFLPNMISRGKGGHVLNVASAAGLIGQPGMSTYCATKHAVVGLSHSLRYELARSRIGVTALCPGYVRTPLAHKVKLVGKLNTANGQQRVAATFEKYNLSAETVAQVAVNAMRKNQAIAVVGNDARLGNVARRYFPSLLDRVLTR